MDDAQDHDFHRQTLPSEIPAMAVDIQSLQRAYDQSPYQSLPFPQSAPERIAAIAHVFGVSTPDPSTARVLELGCASGGNLIPFTARNPRASALGIDLSGRQVADGQATIRALALANIQLRQADLSTLDETLGTFDYIICHGVYSWVPAHVRDALMRICERHLSPTGVAFVSYNTYPGWKAKEIVRDAMLFRSAGQDEPRARLQSARAMIDFLDSAAQPASVLSRVITEYSSTIRDSNDDYVLHEFLEPNNLPCYFHDFLAHASMHGLAYLAEAEPAIMFATNLAREIAEPLLRDYGTDQRQLEQFMDFISNRTFRQTLLFREDRNRQARYRLADDRLRTLHYAADLPCMDGAADYDARPQRFGRSVQHAAGLASPIMKAAAVVLSEAWPATVSVDALMAGIEQKIGNCPPQAEQQLMQFLGVLVRRGIGFYRLQPVVAHRKAGTMPRVADVTRRHAAWIAASGADAHIFNIWHEPVALNAMSMEVLPLLDGQHDADALVAALHVAVQRGRLGFSRHGIALADAELAAEIRHQLEGFLAQLQDMKLLQ